MKIVLLGPAYPFRGGIAAFNDRLAIALKEAGHEVKIVTFSLQYPKLLFPGESQYSEGNKPHDIVTQETLNSISPVNWLKVGQSVKKENADLIISRFWLPFMGPSLGTVLKIAKSNKTKVISIIDNIIPHESRPGDKAFAQYFLNQNDAFMTLSEDVANDLRRFKLKGPVITSPHPLYDHYGEKVSRQEAIKQLRLDDSFRYLLFFGLVRGYKGLDLLLESIPFVKTSNIKLIVAGEFYDKKEKYDEILAKHSLENQVILTNAFIKDEDVKYYFGACDVVVQPYKTATQSGVTQIAYHFEKPMIVTNVGGLPEICPDGKVGYITNSEPQSIADAINRFFEQKEGFFDKGIQSMKKQFSWDVFVNRLEGVYANIK